jgi:hypothetical protein
LARAAELNFKRYHSFFLLRRKLKIVMRCIRLGRPPTCVKDMLLVNMSRYLVHTIYQPHGALHQSSIKRSLQLNILTPLHHPSYPLPPPQHSRQSFHTRLPFQHYSHMRPILPVRTSLRHSHQPTLMHMITPLDAQIRRFLELSTLHELQLHLIRRLGYWREGHEIREARVQSVAGGDV